MQEKGFEGIGVIMGFTPKEEQEMGSAYLTGYGEGTGAGGFLEAGEKEFRRGKKHGLVESFS